MPYYVYAGYEKEERGMNSIEKIRQNMIDAGCGDSYIADISRLIEAGQNDEAIRKLRLCRCGMIEEMHEKQRKLDRLDHLIRMQERRFK